MSGIIKFVKVAGVTACMMSPRNTLQTVYSITIAVAMPGFIKKRPTVQICYDLLNLTVFK